MDNDRAVELIQFFMLNVTDNLLVQKLLMNLGNFMIENSKTSVENLHSILLPRLVPRDLLNQKSI